MILNFTVSNFRSIKDEITLSFEPVTKYREEKKWEHLFTYETKNKKYKVLKLAIIYGANASGKTNILIALDFLRDLVLNPFENLRFEDINYQPFLFNKDSVNRPSKLEIDFIQNEKKYTYFVEFQKNKIIKEKLFVFSPRKSKVFERFFDYKTKEIKIEFGAKYRIPKTAVKTLEYHTLENRTLLNSFLRVNIKLKEVDEVLLWFKDKLQPLIIPEYELTRWSLNYIDEENIDKDFITEILREADFNIKEFYYEFKEEDIPLKVKSLIKELIEIDEEIKDEFLDENKKVKVLKNFEVIHFINDKEYKLDFKFESSGTKRFFSFAVMLYLAKTKGLIFPIDEVESSLHPDLIKFFLLNFLNKTQGIPTQMILTTHFRELLMEKELIRRDIIWFTEKRKDGSTDLYSLADFNSLDIRKENSYYRAYKLGKLGAIPIL